MDTKASVTKQVLQPTRIGVVPIEDEAMFCGEEKAWYTGFLEPWASFQKEVVKFWKSPEFRRAFGGITGHPATEPRNSDLEQLDASHTSEILADHFQREVLEVVEVLHNYMAETMGIHGKNFSKKVILAQSADKDMVGSEYNWDPKFVIRNPSSENEQTKVIGHAEYLAGKPGALSWAIGEQTKNSWGSLRCVLGDMAKWMFTGRIRYGFLTSSDEVIFLQSNIDDYIETVKVGPDDFEEIDVMKTPKLFYSAPIKHSDVLSEAIGTVPVRLALLYLIHLGMNPKRTLPDDIGPALNYAAITKVNENLNLKPLTLFRV